MWRCADDDVLQLNVNQPFRAATHITAISNAISSFQKLLQFRIIATSQTGNQRNNLAENNRKSIVNITDVVTLIHGDIVITCRVVSWKAEICFRLIIDRVACWRGFDQHHPPFWLCHILLTHHRTFHHPTTTTTTTATATTTTATHLGKAAATAALERKRWAHKSRTEFLLFLKK